MPTGTSLTYVAAGGHRPIPLATNTTHRAPHKPWCTDCKKKVDLQPTGLCNQCTRAVATRAAAAERRAQAEAEAAAQLKEDTQCPTPTISNASPKRGSTAPRPSPTTTQPTTPSAPPSQPAPANSTNTSTTCTPEDELAAQLEHATRVLTRTAHSANLATQALRRNAIAALEALHLFTELYDHQTPGPVASTPTGPGHTEEARRRPAGKPTRRASSRKPRLDTFPLAQAQALYLEQQLTCPQIAHELGCAVSTVQRKLKNAGTPMRDDRHNHSGGRNAKTTLDDDPTLRDQVITRYQAGESTVQLAKQHDCSPKQINSILRRADIPLRPRAHIGRPITSEDRADITTAYTAGETLMAIAARLKLKKDRVRTVLVDSGIEIRGRGRSTPQRPLPAPAHQIKAWALDQGLIDQIRVGRVRNELVDAYAIAHPTTEGAHTA